MKDAESASSDFRPINIPSFAAWNVDVCVCVCVMVVTVVSQQSSMQWDGEWLGSGR